MKIGIIGTGAYAIALSSLLENKNYDITMWTKLENEYDELINNHTNLKVIDYKINENIKFTMNINDFCDKDVIILAIPAKFIKNTILEFKNYYKNQHILIATKGIEEENKQFINDFLEKELNTDKIACISGPSFANDVIKKDLIGLTIASKNMESLNIFKDLFSNISYLDIDLTNDIIGCELCGILKNIMAIISGILEGLNLSKSANSKFLTDASLEIQKIIEKLGGEEKTFNRYAGFGDFILTCTSHESRNYTFGYLIGKGEDFNTYQNNNTIEGLDNLNSIYEILKENNIKSDLIDILFEIVYLSKPKEEIIEYLRNSK